MLKGLILCSSASSCCLQLWSPVLGLTWVQLFHFQSNSLPKHLKKKQKMMQVLHTLHPCRGLRRNQWLLISNIPIWLLWLVEKNSRWKISVSPFLPFSYKQGTNYGLWLLSIVKSNCQIFGLILKHLVLSLEFFMCMQTFNSKEFYENPFSHASLVG